MIKVINKISNRIKYVILETITNTQKDIRSSNSFRRGINLFGIINYTKIDKCTY